MIREDEVNAIDAMHEELENEKALQDVAGDSMGDVHEKVQKVNETSEA